MNHQLAITYLAKKDPVLARVIREVGECEFAPVKKQSIFEALVEAIAHQQLHGKAARTIFGRFLELFPATKRKRFPDPAAVLKISPKKLRGVGFSGAKVLAIRDIAKAATQGKIPTMTEARKMSDEDIFKALLPLRGVGRWTVEMFLIFTLGRLDVLPVDDFGVREGFRIAYGKSRQHSPKMLAKYGVVWAPYRTIASWYLWRVADKNKRSKAMGA